MKSLSLVAKFNLVFLAVALAGFIAASALTNALLESNASEETLQNARLLMQASAAAGKYTAARISPLFGMKFEFLPEAVPTFAAIEHLNEL